MKPILFNTEMVRAIQEARKTVTRRVVKPQPRGGICNPPKDPPGLEDLYGNDLHQPYHPGNILWVREMWTKLWYVDPDGYTHYDQPMYYYAADGTPDITLMDEDGFEENDQRIRWRPSIHMPKEAARLFLRVTGMRVERLQDLTITDLQDEGIQPEGYLTQYTALTSNFFERFRTLWNSTIKPADLSIYGWEANPWVWVIEFERISREAALLGGSGDG